MLPNKLLKFEICKGFHALDLKLTKVQEFLVKLLVFEYVAVSQEHI
jgi:hypothetical protein